MGLEDYAKFRPRKLSGGLLRRLNIACGIAHTPRARSSSTSPPWPWTPRAATPSSTASSASTAQGATVVLHEPLHGGGRAALHAHPHHGRGPQRWPPARTTSSRPWSAPARPSPCRWTSAERARPACALCGACRNVRRAHLSPRGMLEAACAQRRPQPGRRPRGPAATPAVAYVRRVYAEPPTLNDVFLEITGTELRD